jgi:hypothetical protein
MLAGDEVRVHRNSIIMIHNPWTYAEGNSDDLRKVADTLDVHRDAILDIYINKTGREEDDLKDMMDGETYFRGVEAKELGFADTVLDNEEEEKAIAAMLRFERAVAEIQTENTPMSKTRTRKEIAASLDEAQAQIEDLETQVASLVDGVTAAQAEHAAEIEGVNARHAQEIEALKADLDVSAA